MTQPNILATKRLTSSEGESLLQIMPILVKAAVALAPAAYGEPRLYTRELLAGRHGHYICSAAGISEVRPYRSLLWVGWLEALKLIESASRGVVKVARPAVTAQWPNRDPSPMSEPYPNNRRLNT